MSEFGQRLKELREKIDISQEELGRRFNLSQSTIAYYESNKKQPSQRTLGKMADYFYVTTDYLLGREEKIVGETESESDMKRKKAKDLLEKIKEDKLDHTLFLLEQLNKE